MVGSPVPETADAVESADFKSRRPMTQPPKSPRTIAQVRVRNRRREYLRRNPAYLVDLEHELADPVMYETLILKFQSRAERDAEAQAKGYSRILEGDLRRGEAKLATLAAEATRDERDKPADAEPQSAGERSSQHSRLDREIILLENDASKDEGISMTKDQARELWNEFITRRFVRGEDSDFDYSRVDADDELDVLERQDAQDAWFDDEEPNWITDQECEDSSHAPTERVLQGETGIQDF